MSRRNVSSLAFLLALLVVVPASAQYMYLDANGDGIHTDADVVPDSGEVVADVWLVTNSDRDGTPALCTTGNYSLSMSSYVVNLHASGGTVAWESFENRVAGFSLLPGGRDSLELEGGAFNMTNMSPGRYLLATIRFAVASGAPRIDFVRESKYITGPTSFGSPCDGLDFDNTQKLGSDWYDTDGLDHVSPNQAPAFEPIQALVLDENTTASRHISVTDTDGDALTLAMQSLPGFATLSTIVQTPGRIDADVEFAPTYAAAGLYVPSPYLVSVVASDGQHQRQTSFRVTVRNVNRPPVILPIADATVEVGSTQEVHVYSSDPDLNEERPSVALVEGPAFASFAAGVIVFRPGLEDAGTYSVRVSASDPFDTVTASFQVTVTNSGLHQAPVFDALPDVWLDEGDRQQIAVRAHGNGEDLISLRLVQGPPYARLYSSDQQGEALGDLMLWPGARDSGTAVVRLEASTTLYSATTELRIHVRNKPFPTELASSVGCVEPGTRGSALFQVYAPDVDSIRVTSGVLPSWARVLYTYVGSYPGSGALVLETTPGPEEPPSSLGITIYLNRNTPEEMSWPATLVISPYDECISFGGGFIDGGDPPIPEAGGPYGGVAGAPVALHAASSPPSAENAYRWTFGDGHAALGSSVSHVYGEGGTYRAIIRVSNQPASRDSANVVIADAYPAQVALDGDRTPLRLSRKDDFCITVEQAGNGYDLADLNPASLWLWVTRGGVADSIGASRTDPIVNPDEGGPRVHACFARADLDRLFAGMHGRLEVEGRVQGRLQNGARVRAPVTITVVGRAWDGGRVVVRPNPLNPSGLISFETEQAGRVRARIYDVSGRLVRTLWDGDLGAGPVDLPFDGRNSHGDALGSGVYYYRIESSGKVRTGRLTVLK